jgi:hypothetical protein
MPGHYGKAKPKMTAKERLAMLNKKKKKTTKKK